MKSINFTSINVQNGYIAASSFYNETIIANFEFCYGVLSFIKNEIFLENIYHTYNFLSSNVHYFYNNSDDLISKIPATVNTCNNIYFGYDIISDDPLNPVNIKVNEIISDMNFKYNEINAYLNTVNNNFIMWFENVIVTFDEASRNLLPCISKIYNQFNESISQYVTYDFNQLNEISQNVYLSLMHLKNETAENS